MKRTHIYALLAAIGLALFLGACAGAAGPPGPEGPQGPAGPQGPPGEDAVMTTTDLSCTECHNDTTLITGKHTAWEESGHGSGEAYVRGTRNSCAGCHSGGGFSERVAAGLNPSEVENGDPNPTRQDCRACHQIHTTYSGDDWALEITEPVDLFAYEGVTYDGGEGNLCVQCHQSRRDIAEAVDGEIEVTSSHWGPHHGPQSAMLLGIGGAGDVEGSPHAHYAMVEDTCVGCHMGDGRNHSFEPQIEACQACHSDAESFDINGVQTEIEEDLAEIEEALLAKGWIDEEGHPIVAFVPEDEAAALWNWIYLEHEDGSHGVHNAPYYRALIQAAFEALE